MTPVFFPDLNRGCCEREQLAATKIAILIQVSSCLLMSLKVLWEACLDPYNDDVRVQAQMMLSRKLKVLKTEPPVRGVVRAASSATKAR